MKIEQRVCEVCEETRHHKCDGVYPCPVVQAWYSHENCVEYDGRGTRTLLSEPPSLEHGAIVRRGEVDHATMNTFANEILDQYMKLEEKVADFVKKAATVSDPWPFTQDEWDVLLADFE